MVDPQTNRLDLEVEKLVYGGDGLSRMEGRVVLTPFVLPGEAVSALVEDAKPGYLRARVEQIRAPATARVEAPCPYFGRCGGCHYQHAAYEYQLEAKRTILVEVLARVGKLQPPGQIEVISGEPWQYRNRSRFHFAGSELGYLRARSHRLCAIDRCPISSPKLNEVTTALKEMLHDRRWPKFIRSLEVFTNERDVQMTVVDSAQPVARRFFDWCAERIGGYVPGPLDYEAAGFEYRVSGQSFFQVNRHLTDRLADAALRDHAGEAAADVYAGVGLFTLPLSQRFETVTAVESGQSAMRDLLFNLERTGLPARAEQSAAEAYLAGLDKAPDLVLLDPPRAGLGRAVVQQLARLLPQRLIIVSCDPATLARDLRGLVDAGYAIEHVAMIDLFPQTYHLETIAHLRRR